jgi:hypothetical protein
MRRSYNFDGETYDPKRDKVRLNEELYQVWRVFQDGVFWTLAELEQTTGYPQASISARLRDLRKPRFGGWNVERRYVADGLHEYRVNGRTIPDASETLGL